MLIKSYGLFWLPEAVDWGKQGLGNSACLDGAVKEKRITKVCNFWDDRGLYALYENYQCVYIGKAVKTPLGKEIANKRNNRLVGRWDSFCWFGLGKRVADKERRGKNGEKKQFQKINLPGSRQFKPGDIIDALEALSIMLVAPPQNRRYEILKEAVQFEQSNAGIAKTTRQYLVEILSKLPDKK